MFKQENVAFRLYLTLKLMTFVCLKQVLKPPKLSSDIPTLKAYTIGQPLNIECTL